MSHRKPNAASWLAGWLALVLFGYPAGSATAQQAVPAISTERAGYRLAAQGPRLIDGVPSEGAAIPPLRVTVPDEVNLSEATPTPHSDQYLAPAGPIKALMVFVDFEDAKGVGTTDSRARFLLGDGAAQAWFRDQSKGRSALDVTFQHGWKRMPKSVKYYRIKRGDYWELDWQGDPISKLDEYIRDCMGLYATDRINFAKYDVLLIVAAKTGRPSLSPTHPYRTVNAPYKGGGRVHRVVTFFDDSYVNRWTNLVHELGHQLGLPDLYSYGDPLPQEPDRWALMGNNLVAYGLLGWHRHKLGWLDDEQVRYLKSGSLTETLRQHATTEGVSMIVVPGRDGRNRILPNRVFVVEVTQPYYRDGRASRKAREPAGEGVLVYSVDANIPTGQGPVKVFGKDDDPLRPWKTGETFSHQEAPLSVIVGKKIGEDFRVTVKVKRAPKR